MTPSINDDFYTGGIFRCPACRGPLVSDRCADCGFAVEHVAGIPLLARNRPAVEAAIASAKNAGRAAWYEAEQDAQWHGPYRHHLEKRRAFLHGVLNDFRRTSATPLFGLDLGCGDGGHLGWLARYVESLYGSDYNIDRLRRAKARPGARVFLADIADQPVRDASLDVILFNHVLEHIPDDASALAEARRILKPGGLLILGVPNEGALFWQLAYRLQPNVRKHSDHVHFYIDATIAARCRAAGFAVKHIEHIGWGVPHWRLDEALRRHRWADDRLEQVGRRLFRRQATSLYLILSR